MDPDEYMCMDCGRAFATEAGCAVHRAKAHGQSKSAAIKAVLRDGICPSCEQDFRSRPRCVQHLAYGSAACRRAFEAGAMPRLSDEEQALAQLVEDEHRKLCRRRGVNVLCGLPVIR